MDLVAPAPGVPGSLVRGRPGQNLCRCQELDLPQRLQQDFQEILPDIFYTNFFRHGRYSVIAVGRDVKHRTRAGCLGLAALICQSKVDQMQLTEVQRLVVDEVRKSGWFPQELLGFVQKVLCFLLYWDTKTQDWP